MIKLRDILNEIGETTETFPYEQISTRAIKDRDGEDAGYEITYQFEGDPLPGEEKYGGELYNVVIRPRVEADGKMASDAEVELKSLDYGHGSTNTGLKQAFKVMATTVKIAKDVANEYSWLNTFKFYTSAPDKETPESKKNLYLAFIKKQFPGAEVKTSELVSGVVSVKFR